MDDSRRESQRPLVACRADLQIKDSALRVLDSRIGDALRFMQAKLQFAISVNDMAHEVGLSPSRFAHTFRAETGSSPARMLLRMRLERAAELLSTTGLPLKQVGELVGMAHAGRFGRVFRGWYGMTPSQFRKNNRRRSSRTSRVSAAESVQ